MIEVAGVHARVGAFALNDVTFRVPDGAYGVVIGPAGAGKTTLLEVLAGVIPLGAGTVRLNGRDVRRVPPEARDIGLVYQHAYLFPHLSVEANVAYGAITAAFARDVAVRVGADTLLSRPVRSLSGGERQLVALARALARRPKIVLLDEPFAALDPRRRATVRRAVRTLVREIGATVLQVTHDFTEAGLLGDVAVLLESGRVLQAGPPDEVFRKPASPYVAEFLGAENIYPGTADRLADGAVAFHGPLTLYAVGDIAPGAGYAIVRAEEVILSAGPPGSSARNVFAGHVQAIEGVGPLTRVTVDIHGTPLVAALTTRSAEELALGIGSPVVASFKAMAVHLC